MRTFDPRPGEAPAVILLNPKFEHNAGAALRACSCFGLKQLWWTGGRVDIDPERGERLPREERMKGYREVACCRSERPLDYFDGVAPVCVELAKGSQPLTTFTHPERAVYLFGPEDGSVPAVWKRHCHHFVYIPADHCLNLSTAVAVVLAHRRMTRQLAGLEPILPLAEQLREHRGCGATPVLDAMGWDGK